MPRVVSNADRAIASHPYVPQASRVIGVAGLVYLVGSVIDLGVLWLLQRQPGVQWEFVAITNTVDAWPRMVLAMGLIYVAAALGGLASDALFKVMALLLVVLGLLGAVFGGLATLNYLSVRGSGVAGQGEFLRASIIKTLTLCGLYFVLLVPIGVMGLKKPERA